MPRSSKSSNALSLFVVAFTVIGVAVLWAGFPGFTLLVIGWLAGIATHKTTT